MATSKYKWVYCCVKINCFHFRRLLFITEISFLGLYEIDWQIEYEDLKEEPVVKPNLSQIQILTKVIFH
jgi:hypothetical protein